MVDVDDGDLFGGEDKRGKAAHEDRGGKDLVSSDGTSKVAILMFGQTSRENGVESLGVGAGSGLDGRDVAKDSVAYDTNVLGLSGEWDDGATQSNGGRWRDGGMAVGWEGME